MTEVHHTRSNLISMSSYNITAQQLSLTFNNGGTYVYKDVPNDVYQALMSAESIGQYFHAHIKGKYKTEKI